MFSEEFERALERLLSARTEAEKWAEIQDYFKVRGFPIINYSFIDGAGVGVEEAPVRMRSTADPEFLNDYAENRRDLVDPLADYGRSGRPGPYLVSNTMEESLSGLNENRKTHLDFVAAESHTSNLLIPLPTGLASGPLRSGVVLGTSIEAGDLQEIIGRYGAELIVFAHHMHAELRGVILRQLAGDEPLTNREADCLSYIARGERPERIADLIGLSTATVNFHLRNARRKLNARTTAEAVAKAMRYAAIAL